MNDNEFEDYYRNFEYVRLGHSSINGHLLQSHFLDDIIRRWFSKNSCQIQNHSHISFDQMILECLAYNGSLTLKQLAKETDLKKEDVLVVLNNYSINNANTITNNPTNELIDSSHDLVAQREIYFNFILHNLIVSVTNDLETRYELSLCGIMLVIALVYYHYTGTNNLYIPKTSKSSTSTANISNLLYNNIGLEEYYDKIAHNYEIKMPLIFGRWDDFKQKFGSLLYDSFNFLISREAKFNSINKSIWLGGNKEFYDDLKALAQDTRIKLYPIYKWAGNYQKVRRISRY